MSKLFLITSKEGETQEVEGPGQAGKAVLELQGTAEEPKKGGGKGKGNLVPVLAQLKPGQALEVGCVRVERIESDEDDEDDEDEPEPPVTPPGGDQGQSE